MGSTITIDSAFLNSICNYTYSTATSKANLRMLMGAASQTADARLQTLFPTEWSSNHRARGVAYFSAEFAFDETAFPSGVPAVNALVRGAKVFDPRTSTTAWTDNPALLMRHVYTHPFFGKQSATAEDDARINAAANACDVVQAYSVGGVTQNQKLYRAGVMVPYGSEPRGVLDDLAQAMGGAWAASGSALFVKPGVWQASVLSLTDADLAVVQGADLSLIHI